VPEGWSTYESSLGKFAVALPPGWRGYIDDSGPIDVLLDDTDEGDVIYLTRWGPGEARAQDPAAPFDVLPGAVIVCGRPTDSPLLGNAGGTAQPRTTTRTTVPLRGEETLVVMWQTRRPRHEFIETFQVMLSTLCPDGYPRGSDE
jgi:hypothetical protein